MQQGATDTGALVMPPGKKKTDVLGNRRPWEGVDGRDFLHA